MYSWWGFNKRTKSSSNNGKLLTFFHSTKKYTFGSSKIAFSHGNWYTNVWLDSGTHLSPFRRLVRLPHELVRYRVGEFLAIEGSSRAVILNQQATSARHDRHLNIIDIVVIRITIGPHQRTPVCVRSVVNGYFVPRAIIIETIVRPGGALALALHLVAHYFQLHRDPLVRLAVKPVTAEGVGRVPIPQRLDVLPGSRDGTFVNELATFFVLFSCWNREKSTLSQNSLGNATITYLKSKSANWYDIIQSLEDSWSFIFTCISFHVYFY